MKEAVTVTIDEDVLEGIDKRAKCCGMNRSSYVEMCLLREVGGEARVRQTVVNLALRLATMALSGDKPVISSDRPLERVRIKDTLMREVEGERAWD